MNRIILILFLAPVLLFSQNKNADTVNLRLKFEKVTSEKIFRLSLWDSICTEAKKLKVKKIEAKSLDVIGTINRNLGDLGKAADAYIACIKIMQELNDKQGIASASNGLGIVYRSLGDTLKAEEYFLATIKLAEEINDKAELSAAYNSLAIIEKSRNNFEKAINYYTKSLAIRKEMNYEFGIAEIYFNMGTLYKSQKDLKTAKEYFKKSYDLFSKVNDNQGKSYSLNYLAGIYVTEKNYSEAETCSKKALEIGNQINLPKTIRNASQTLYKIYSATGKYKDALDMHVLYTKMRDSINNDEMREAGIKSTMKFDYEKRAAADSVRVAKEKEVVAIQLQKEETQRYALYGGLALTIVFGGFMFNRFRITQKQKIIIEQQKKIVEQKQKEVIDSIHYAKRIQQSLLPTEKYIDKSLKRLKK